MSVPRPAMLVATVTAPLRPACATMRDSRSCCLALSTWCGMPALFRISAIASDFSIEMRADEHRLAALVIMADAVVERIVFLKDAVHDGFEFFFLGAIDDVGMLFADERAVRRNRDDIEIVDFAELGGFGFRGAGHAGELFVHAEIILEGDRGERLVFALDLDAFFGFDGLVQAIGPAAAGHLAAGEFVDDDDFAVFDDVIDVVFVKRVSAQRLIDVVHHVDVGGVGHVRRVREGARTC